MTRAQINSMLDHRQGENGKLLETHISWLYFTDELVYKMKKNIQYSFLDFSTLEKRKFYCEQELKLNRRLAPHIYLDVVPICELENQISLESDAGVPIGYAVKMKRVEEAFEMDRMLLRNEVTPQHIEQLAQQLSTFHKHARSITSPFDAAQAWKDYADIRQQKPTLISELGSEAGRIIEESIPWVKTFLQQYHHRFLARSSNGFVVDGHGDLHTGNIFLGEAPIVFDCIEFNDEFRQLDVLNEIAFLYSDLEAYHKTDLADHFIKHYLASFSCMPHSEDPIIFQYYKLFRANVKLKVIAIKLDQAKTSAHRERLRNRMQTFYALFLNYLAALKSKL